MRRPYVFLTYVNDSKSTIKRVTDCASCLKKNEFKITADIFENDLVGSSDVVENCYNQRYDKVCILLGCSDRELYSDFEGICVTLMKFLLELYA